MQGGLPHYDFDSPEKTWELPKALTEVSGIAFTGPSTLALVQDERGSLYFLDLEEDSDGDVSRSKFGPKGDYEGLDRAGDRLLVLRSDGAVLELDLEGSALGDFKQPLETVPYTEFESIAFEPTRDRWLVMPKDRVSKGDRRKDDRVLFGLSPGALMLDPEPVLVLSVKETIQAAEERGWPLPTRVSKKGNEKIDFDFRPSDLAVHPITGDYFMISGKDRTLIVVSPAGELLGTATFPASMLAQPEGLAFQPNGDLLIASEGVGGKKRRAAVIKRFPFRTR